MASPTPRAADAPEAGAREALGTVDPTPYFQKYGENLWAPAMPRYVPRSPGDLYARV